MIAFLKSRWELITGLVIFIVAKIPVLNYPFYWDESWSYAPGVKLMYLHGPSLMPNAIDVFYSRGHPLLFYASAAAWMKVFGDSHIAQHSFCLLLSVLLIAAIYEVANSIFNKRVALLSLIMLPIQVIFFVQSTFLLPEVMVALLTLVSLFLYIKQKYILTFICLTALMLTKESGMVLGLVLGFHATINLLNKKENLSVRFKNFGSVFLAGIVIGSFFLLQKSLNGWYFYPEHTGYIQFNKYISWNKLRFALDLFFNHNFHLFHLLLLFGVVVAVHLKDARYLMPLLPAYFVYVAIEDKFKWLPRKILFVFFLLSLAFVIYQFLSLSIVKAKEKTRFTWLSILFFAAYLTFTVINFFTARYVITIIVIAILLTAAIVDMYLSALYETIYYITLGLIVVIGFYSFKYDVGLGDINFGAFDGMVVEEALVNFCEKENLYDKNIAIASFQTREHLQKPFTGFLHSEKTFKNLTFDIMPNTNYIVFDNIEADVKYDTLLKQIKNSPDYDLIFKIRKGQAETEVYEKKK